LTSGPGEHEVGVARGDDVLGEAVDDADRVLQAVPARHLDDVALAESERTVLDHRRPPLDAPGGAVEALEHRLGAGVRAVDQAGRVEDRLGDRVGHVLVLRRERVDRRGDDDPLVRVEVLPDERLAGEDVGVGLLDVRLQEGPRLARKLVRGVDPDVAAPHDRDAGVADVRDQPGGLRVVEDDRVALAERLAQRLAGALQRCLVRRPLLVAERAAVALGAVQPVVDALRDREERGVAADHQPARVDADPLRVGEQRLQHLGHATAARGRVEVPDAPPVEDLPRAPGRLEDAVAVGLGEHAREALERQRADVDRLQMICHVAPIRRRCRPRRRSRRAGRRR
jgi:hypothetical protein